MENNTFNSKKLVDFSQYFNKEKNASLEQENTTGNKRKFSLSYLKDYWLSSDKKLKVDIIIFLAIASAVLGILIFHFIITEEKVINLPQNYNEKMFFQK